MVGPMPMALGCLAGGREMRQVGVAVKRRGVGTSAGSGRGDDRGLTHVFTPSIQVMGRRAEARSQRAGKPEGHPLLHPTKSSVVSTYGGCRRRCRTAQRDPPKRAPPNGDN